ncbi:MAG: RiPP maturation radical SAM protein 1 [Candidatus Aminicenantes bacterium]|nr:RiPP maturation radical SAM protein 1 [Candidatus Aminicenantes bacterium]NIM77289.1 RiPP maturation radical SAM protein 1 [Candidatus Aminicenantes bacterium]NIN16590.1 RiPP maturation radical SAM protein 1 [Candidatus Aminicenantes bacterium]NIN40448.1 RiPP maturation radical SAM protein 1 [Candidatus Aminicenantes bacterium]NIN83268.1 RiPP maturation radical SAM protein 1 [Candidatus Aminicenantes bacterium]
MINTFFRGVPEEGDALLLVSPLYWTKAPILSLHLLQAGCGSVGLTTHVLYTNLLYSLITGSDLHIKIARESHLFLGERLFVSSVFGGSTAGGWLDKFSNPGWLPDHTWKIKPHMANQVSDVLAPFRQWIGTADWQHLESLTTQWVRKIGQRIANMGYPVVGCSTSPGGLVPAIALLDSIKKANANVITVIGGALCDGAMAEGVLSLKTGIDYVLAGEGEITFPDFVRKVRDGHLPGEKIIAGEPVKDLDTIPIPDYQEYFQQLAALPASNRPSPGIIEIPYETSRGCWFGKCPFCGYYGKKNFYREKSPNRVIDALGVLIQRHGIHTVYMTDNIMPNQYTDTLLPKISKEIPSLHFHFDIKSNLTLEQVLSLKRAGAVSIEPGIESLSSSLLKRMRKGVTVRENIALLRYARATSLDISWFLLVGIPGEEMGEYEEMLRLLPLIRHLPPANGILPMMIFRFSSYQKYPQAFGISNLRPAEVYNDIFPSYAHLEKIACYFTGDFKTQANEHPEIIIALAKEYLAWKKAWAIYKMVPLEFMLPMLHITQKSRDEYVLEDTRGLPGIPERRVLNREQASILLVSRPQDSSADYHWAVDAQLGVLRESWFIPLATADPGLVLEFERDYASSNVNT